jgi:hypothetical protein
MLLLALLIGAVKLKPRQELDGIMYLPLLLVMCIMVLHFFDLYHPLKTAPNTSCNQSPCQTRATQYHVQQLSTRGL